MGLFRKLVFIKKKKRGGGGWEGDETAGDDLIRNENIVLVDLYVGRISLKLLSFLNVCIALYSAGREMSLQQRYILMRRLKSLYLLFCSKIQLLLTLCYVHIYHVPVIAPFKCSLECALTYRWAPQFVIFVI